jgi:hypothetical protein
VSTCREVYEPWHCTVFGKAEVWIHYQFFTADGGKYETTTETLEEARAGRDRWLATLKGRAPR